LVDEVFIEEYNEEWPQLFKALGFKLRESLGEAAVRIDHIGSTSIPRLSAKPIIDIQITVRHLERMELYRERIESVGFVFRSDNPDLTKRYFREMPGTRRTHIHVREEGSWSQQFSLLFRDYLRCHEEDRKAYERAKYRLAETYRKDRRKYVEAKEPVIWSIMRKASAWSQLAGWKPKDTDA